MTQTTARGALREGALRLVSRPGTLAASLLAGAAASLALRVGTATLGRSSERGHLGAGLLLALVAAATAAMLVGSALAAALTEDEAEVVAPSRGLAIVSLWAIERVIAGSLVLAALAPALRLIASHSKAAPAALGLGVALTIAPPLFIALVTGLAFRVAVARAAAGLPSEEALAVGVDAALSQMGPLLRLVALGVIFTAPLSLLQLALGKALAATHNAVPTLFAEALRGAASLLVAAWLYAALSALVRAPAPPDREAATAAPPPADPSPPPPADSLPA